MPTRKGTEYTKAAEMAVKITENDLAEINRIGFNTDELTQDQLKLLVQHTRASTENERRLAEARQRLDEARERNKELAEQQANRNQQNTAPQTQPQPQVEHNDEDDEEEVRDGEQTGQVGDALQVLQTGQRAIMSQHILQNFASYLHYSGKDEESVTTFIRQLEIQKRHTNLPEEDLLQVVPNRLKGKALDWYQSLGNNTLATWRTLKQAMLAKFDDAAHKRTVRHMLSNYTMDTKQSVSEYAIGYEKLANLAGSSEQDKLDGFIRGLTHKLRKHVSLTVNPETFAEAVTAAKHYEVSVKSFKEDKQGKTNTAQLDIASIKAVVQEVVQKPTCCSGHCNTQNSTPNTPRASHVAAVQNNQIKCYQCGKLGHVAKECRSKKQTQTPQNFRPNRPNNPKNYTPDTM